MRKTIIRYLIAISVLIPGIVEANVTMVVLEGNTDATGRFLISHQYLAEPAKCEGTYIVGATVAIRSAGNKAWYTMADRNEKWHAISWSDRKVSGYFSRPGFENQPVRIVLFLTNRIC